MKLNYWQIGALLLVAAGTGFIYGWRFQSQPATSQAVPVTAQASDGGPDYPLPTEEHDHAKSGGTTEAETDPGQGLEDSINAVAGLDVFEKILVKDNFIQRFVVTVENLGGPAQPTGNFLALHEPAGEFLATSNGKQIDPENFRRYNAYVEFAKTLDAKRSVDLYVRNYPRFQEAYSELGLKGYFNDRLVRVLDLLLTTPKSSGRVALSRPTLHNRYKFANDNFESLASGQKILLRMGDENASVLKYKIREIRNLLVRRKKPAPPST